MSRVSGRLFRWCFTTHLRSGLVQIGLSFQSLPKKHSLSLQKTQGWWKKNKLQILKDLHRFTILTGVGMVGHQLFDGCDHWPIGLMRWIPTAQILRFRELPLYPESSCRSPPNHQQPSWKFGQNICSISRILPYLFVGFVSKWTIPSGFGRSTLELPTAFAPKNHPFEKEKNLNQSSILGFKMLVFGGVPLKHVFFFPVIQLRLRLTPKSLGGGWNAVHPAPYHPCASMVYLPFVWCCLPIFRGNAILLESKPTHRFPRRCSRFFANDW